MLTGRPLGMQMALHPQKLGDAVLAQQAGKAACTGRRHKAKRQVLWVNLSPRRQGRDDRVGGGRTPFHGYYFKIITQQGPAAAGGELDYVVKGQMIGGFALFVYPAEYRNSGVMTFIVNHGGAVFQKDLGPNTAQVAQCMTSINPDRTWQAVTDTEPLRRGNPSCYLGYFRRNGRQASRRGSPLARFGIGARYWKKRILYRLRESRTGRGWEQWRETRRKP
jgi:DUF2950 family protein